MKIYGSILSSLLLFASACGPQSHSLPEEAWHPSNDPLIMAVSPSDLNPYTFAFAELPLEGQLPTLPWSDDYWPSYRGGISYRWHQSLVLSDQERYAYPLKAFEELTPEEISVLSPAEKYDLFWGRSDYPLTNSERYRTGIMKTVVGSPEYSEGHSIPTWWGLCHAWAPASLLFTEPGPVTLLNPQGIEVAFGSSDVKALLTYFLHAWPAPSIQFLGLRCDLDFAALKRELDAGTLSLDAYNAAVEGLACRDTNAGAFHLVLANQIARLGQGFIADVTRDEQVWNQSVHSYESRIVAESDTVTPGAAAGTVKEITVETTMHYTEEVSAAWQPQPKPLRPGVKNYAYVVELDAGGFIVGGRWISSERPDFLWKQTLPAFSGYFEPLGRIYEAATSTVAR